MGGFLCNRADDVNNYRKTENKWKRELKSLKKQKNMLYSMAPMLGSRRDIKNIKKINKKALKKRS